MRLIRNIIKLKELTTEDEYRKAKGLPPKEDDSPYDILEKYKDDPMVMVSFRDEYYTKTKRLGINFESGFDSTPNGIYCYPLNKMWKKFDHKKRRISNIPFVGDEIPETIVIIRLKGRGLNLKKYTEKQFTKDFSILQNKYGDSLSKELSNYYTYKLLDKFNISYKNSYLIWAITKDLCFKNRKIESTNLWNLIFSRDLGYNWVLDYGLSIIHGNEPTQCVVFKSEGFELLNSIDISKLPFYKPAYNITIEAKLLKNISKLFQEKNIDKIIFLLNKYPNLISKNLVNIEFDFVKDEEILEESIAYKLIYNEVPLKYIFDNDIFKPYIEEVKNKFKDSLSKKKSLLNMFLNKFLFIQDLDILKYFDIDVNIKYDYITEFENKFDYTPLHTACKLGNLEMVKLLLKQPNIDVNAKNLKKETPLHIACIFNYIEIVELLLEQPDIDVNIKDNNGGRTPLNYLTSNIEIVKLLLEHPNIDVNIKDDYGKTFLHKLCQYKNIKIVELLLEYPNIKINIRDTRGETPLSVTRDEEIKKLLIQHGATK